MTLRDEFWDLVEHTPEGVTTVTLEVDWLRHQLEVDTASESDKERNGGDNYLTTSEAGRRLGVAPRTVARWCRDERLPNAIKTGEEGDGEWRIPSTDVQEGPTEKHTDDDGRVRFQRREERDS